MVDATFDKIGPQEEKYQAEATIRFKVYELTAIFNILNSQRYGVGDAIVIYNILEKLKPLIPLPPVPPKTNGQAPAPMPQPPVLSKKAN